MTPYYDKDGITLYHGDCREVLPELPAASFNVTVADSPYGARRPSARRSVGERFQEVSGNGDVVSDWLAPTIRTTAHGGCIYVFTCWDVLERWREAISAVGYRVRSCIVWDKEIHGLADLETCWAPRHEMILFAAKGRHILRGRRPQDILRVPRIDASKLRHPYEKPVSLISRILRASASVGDSVLDPFAGTGATLRAAKDFGLKAVGVELEERYCEIAAKRLEQGVFAFAD